MAIGARMLVSAVATACVSFLGAACSSTSSPATDSMGGESEGRAVGVAAFADIHSGRLAITLRTSDGRTYSQNTVFDGDDFATYVDSARTSSDSANCGSIYVAGALYDCTDGQWIPVYGNVTDFVHQLQTQLPSGLAAALANSQCDSGRFTYSAPCDTQVTMLPGSPFPEGWTTESSGNVVTVMLDEANVRQEIVAPATRFSSKS